MIKTVDLPAHFKPVSATMESEMLQQFRAEFDEV